MERLAPPADRAEPAPPRLRPRAAIAVLAAALLASAACALVAHQMPVDAADRDTAAWLHAQARPWVTSISKAVTNLGGFDVVALVVLVSAAGLLLRRRAAAAALVVAAAVGAEALDLGLKAAFDRQRPSLVHPLATAGSSSFPSGHATVSSAAYLALAIVLAGEPALRPWRALLLSLAGLLVLAIGFSRLYLGVHYLSDVIAGFGVGLAWLVCCLLVWQLTAARSPAAAP